MQRVRSWALLIAHGGIQLNSWCMHALSVLYLASCFSADRFHLLKLKYNSCGLVRGRMCQICAFLYPENEYAGTNSVGLKHGPLDWKMSPSTAELFPPCEHVVLSLPEPLLPSVAELSCSQPQANCVWSAWSSVPSLAAVSQVIGLWLGEQNGERISKQYLHLLEVMKTMLVVIISCGWWWHCIWKAVFSVSTPKPTF